MEPGDASPVLEALFAGAPAGLAYWDAEVRYRRVNPRQAEIDGIPAEQHLGRAPAELRGEAGEQIEALVRQVLQTAEPAVDVEMSVNLNGATQHWMASFFPVPDAEGVGGIVVDVTGRKAVEERERAARDRAEALVRASTALTSSMRPRPAIPRSSGCPPRWPPARRRSCRCLPAARCSERSRSRWGRPGAPTARTSRSWPRALPPAPASRSTTRGCSQSRPKSPTRCRARCFPRSCRTSRASSWPRATAPPGGATRSAATSTTSSTPAAANG